MRHYTSIEQSKKLLELGLSPESADMFYEYVDEDHWRNIPECAPIMDGDLPCWSVGALLEAMPTVHKFEEDYLPIISKYQEFWNGKENNRWSCAYQTEHDSGSVGEIIGFIEDTQIDVCYNMVVWLLENNYIKKEE